MTRYAIGVDVGGSSAKAGVYALSGALVGAGSTSYAPRQPTLGVAEYDADELIAAAESSIRQALRQSGVRSRDIVAICCDAMISGTVGLGADGRPTTAYTTTLDTRFNTHLAHLLVHERDIRTEVGSGNPVVAAKIAWYRDSCPEVFERTSVFVLAGGLVGGSLAGLGPHEAFVDPSVLWAIGLSDTRTQSWSPRLLSTLDITESVLPRIVSCTSVIGAITVEVAGRTGLRSGTPVVAGCGDQMAGFLGADALRPGVVGDSSGTFEVVGKAVSEFSPSDTGLFDVIPHPIEPGYVNQTVVVIGGGFTWDWFCTTVLGIDSSDRRGVEEIASSAPVGSDGLLFLPHLGGQGAPSRPALRGGWLGLGWQHQRSHLTRSVLEAVAYEISDAVEAFGSLSVDATIVGYGGGVRNSITPQIRADVAGIRFESLGDITPTTAAAAFLGAVGIGDLDDIDGSIRSALPTPDIFTPDAHKNQEYQEIRDRYRRAIAAAATLPEL